MNPVFSDSMRKPNKKTIPVRPTAQPRWPFYLILSLFPLLVFAAIELVLRLAVDDPTSRLVLLRESNDQKFYQLNPRVGERFFFGGVAAIPEVYPQKFSHGSMPEGITTNVLRVFCLGSSTMASFPFELNARVSSLLQDRLEALFPDKRVEVINAGMSAINSYAVGEFIRELVHYEPDLFILYMGHNEFYGALGVGSTQSLGQSRWLIRTYLRLQKLRTFQLLRRAISHSKSALHNQATDAKNQTLMEGMAREKTIPLNSEIFQRGVDQFRLNLADIISVAKSHEVPIIVSTLVSNLRSMEPFVSEFSPTTNEPQKRDWQQHFEAGGREQRAGNHTEAIASFQAALTIDDEPPILHYRLAQSLEAFGDSAQALREYESARDLDQLRFRAPAKFNEIIRETCSQLEVPVVEMETAFASSSRHGIVGEELISEHLHPNFEGYFMMAKTFAEAIVNSGALGTSSQPANEQRSDDFFREASAVTELDLEIGASSIAKLTSRWPFRRDQFPELKERGVSPIVRQLVEEYRAKKIAWNTAHSNLAEHYQSLGQFDAAIREYRAIIKIVPDYDSPYARIAEIMIKQNKLAEADSVLSAGIFANDRSPHLHAKRGLVNFLRHDFSKSTVHFQRAIELNLASKGMSTSDLAAAHYYLALSQIKRGDISSAQTNLQTTIHYQPQNAEATRLLALLKRGIPVDLQF